MFFLFVTQLSTLNPQFSTFNFQPSTVRSLIEHAAACHRAFVQKIILNPVLCEATITPERIYLAPHIQLRKSISHYTVYTPKSAVTPTSLTIVPDASGSLVCRLAKEGGAAIETWFWGPSSHAVEVERAPEKYPLYIMVEFLPCGAHSLLGIPMRDLRDAIIPLPLMNVALHNVLVESMERLATRSCDTAFVCAALDTVFLRLLAQCEALTLARYVVGEVQRTNGTLRTSELSRQLGYSTRQLARIMSEHLGMSAKSLARIIRINVACRSMASPAASLTDLAHRLCYHDQSHFIHDFVDICRVTPGEYRLRMSHFYNEELKLGAIVPKK